MVTLFLETHFDAAHYLPGHPKCNMMHGHTYPIEVEVGGNVSENGMIVDLADLKELVGAVLPDHCVLNDVSKTPTAENLVVWLAELLSEELEERGLSLVSLKLYEGLGKGAIWRS